jgi:MFS family permease
MVVKNKNHSIINKAIKTLLTFIFLFNVSAGLYLPIIAIYVTQHVVGATLAVVGVSIAIYSIVKAIFQIPIARRLDMMKGERDDFYILLFGILMAIIYSFAFILIKDVWHLYVLNIFTGIADACIMASYYAIFSHHIDKDSQGYEWSLFSVGGLTISASVGGLIGGYVATNYGFSTVFIISALFNTVAALVLVILFPYVKNFRLANDYKKLKINR